MRRVVMDMQALFASAIEDALRRSAFGFDTVKAKSPEQTVNLCREKPTAVLLMDAMTYPPRTLAERLKIRDELKKSAPDCKVVLMVDEKSEGKVADKVRLAKKDGLIDDFIYSGSASAAYIAAVIDALEQAAKPMTICTF